MQSRGATGPAGAGCKGIYPIDRREPLRLESRTEDDAAPGEDQALWDSRLFRHLAGLAVSFVLIGSASSGWAWGDLGHQIVCQIAFQELNDKDRAEVVRLIALDERFQSFTDACTWPDHPRKRAEEHFVNVSRSLQSITTTGCHGVPLRPLPSRPRRD